MHFILSPTLGALIYIKILHIINPKIKIIISAIQPQIVPLSLLRYLSPNLILVQSSKSESFFNSLNFKTKFYPNGVDINRFHPVDVITKQQLRNKYGLSENIFYILHLASFKQERNLQILNQLNNIENCKLLLVGRKGEKVDRNLIEYMENGGSIIWIKHFESIEEIYHLADCYIFPTIDSTACIETPLSILEAMACNLPIVTSRFGVLPRLFVEKNGFFYFDDQNEMENKILIIKEKKIQVLTREMVLPFSWTNLVNDLLKIYYSE